ncbi:MAG: ATP-binding protein [Phycisphaerales bacterium JB040]
MADGPPHIRLELVSNPVYLSGARELINAIAKRVGFNDLDCSKISLAVDEALCNIIRHGYDRAPDKPIWISIWPLDMTRDHRPAGGLRLVIEDEARQVPPERMKSRDLDDVRPGGLGVHIIQEIMDGVTYERRPEIGMRLTLVKHAPDNAEPPRVTDSKPERPAADRHHPESTA